MTMRPRVLVVAGTDSSGGAGLSRDVEALSAFGVRASVAVTAVTAQTHDRVAAVEPISSALVAAQMTAALEAEPTGAVKIGMLATKGTVEAVASVLREHAHIPVVLDPVLVSSSGGILLEKEAIAVLKRGLLPLCRLATPNWPELAVLANARPAEDEEAALRQGEALLETGCQALLVKGGHAPEREKSTDILLRRGEAPLRFDAPRANTTLRGSGCLLASGITGGLAKGMTLEEGIALAKEQVSRMFAAR
ncbi:hydroxymethylpyrimidine/phosphomethylpyrimidine kinase [Chelativorans sp. AA-79]|uniref:hydroxymethylpyrimidine/phosphomethylpyrimidine kinase n=1 Tax=Chelativorans sp. AA-79 TaxID=3028735 RepID=UPI0023F9B9FC|nr:hydroxymethylpyrimidine/phosphomethylpyrimidine kinase [Chelativorans sp. AA-79]WEX08870.1 hydroxymethylpyrimidine/phosphomethylpyrimidine kinase [Chelativorans sp. AA-79]